MHSGKAWGRTDTLLKTPFVEVHKLEIAPNSRCSLHCHKFKWNYFVVITGRLWIEVHRLSYDLVDITELGPGDDTTVQPNEFHRFITKDEGATGVEIYYPEPLSEDIVRKDVGGKAT